MRTLEASLFLSSLLQSREASESVVPSAGDFCGLPCCRWPLGCRAVGKTMDLRLADGCSPSFFRLSRFQCPVRADEATAAARKRNKSFLALPSSPRCHSAPVPSKGLWRWGSWCAAPVLEFFDGGTNLWCVFVPSVILLRGIRACWRSCGRWVAGSSLSIHRWRQSSMASAVPGSGKLGARPQSMDDRRRLHLLRLLSKPVCNGVSSDLRRLGGLRRRQCPATAISGEEGKRRSWGLQCNLTFF